MLPLDKQNEYRRRYAALNPQWQASGDVYERLVRESLLYSTQRSNDFSRLATEVATTFATTRLLDLGGGRGGLIELIHGGVGFAAFNCGNYCGCEFSRFTLDYFRRSIAPEYFQYAVAVLDANGNLILRIGRCGNADDGVPLGEKDALSTQRSIGGDEVGLFNPAYVATHTDRRIFISDTGNGRIVSVKMGYHLEEKVALKDVPDQQKK